MAYRESATDKKLRAKFLGDNDHANLRRIRLRKGTLRGLTAIDIAFDYPIVGIAGRNGAGKSTVLAMAACAFHNESDGFALPKRKSTYYTFSDFFVQHKDEISPQGIEINYLIAHNDWAISERMPSGVGQGYQSRKKNKGGKWNDYSNRVDRNVAFLGIERIVPHSERSQSRSYSRVFKTTNEKGWEKKVRDDVSYVLNRKYEELRILEHSKYSLPIVKVDKVIYSGFNMGAGENALFEIFSTLYSSGEGSLLIVDEIELGLHADAQRRLVERLKEVCLKNHNQIICTTHSREIFERLPPDARFFLECINGKTRITPQISSEFAFAKLKSANSMEMEIFVEDDVARTIAQAFLPADIRTRVSLKVIGSASAVARQLAASFLRNSNELVIALFDGDQRKKAAVNAGHASSMAEAKDGKFDTYFNSRAIYLPGDTWPESWLVNEAKNHITDLASYLSCDEDFLCDALEYGLQAGKHNEIHEIAQQLGIGKDACLNAFASVISRAKPSEFGEIVAFITGKLEAAS